MLFVAGGGGVTAVSSLILIPFGGTAGAPAGRGGRIEPGSVALRKSLSDSPALTDCRFDLGTRGSRGVYGKGLLNCRSVEGNGVRGIVGTVGTVGRGVNCRYVEGKGVGGIVGTVGTVGDGSGADSGEGKDALFSCCSLVLFSRNLIPSPFLLVLDDILAVVQSMKNCEEIDRFEVGK